ncbi:hypothetical protein ACFQVC_13320 [Streptomyces monticola]|uniref:Uncharacterized protein n=1 Tax=Streptomyces monticola TaxID=2666263 RepID=A0ABW2JI66_9ACTN
MEWAPARSVRVVCVCLPSRPILNLGLDFDLGMDMDIDIDIGR